MSTLQEKITLRVESLRYELYIVLSYYELLLSR